MKNQNPPPGTTRKEMTKEEKDWLRDFNRATQQGDRKALKKIVPKEKIDSIDTMQQQIDRERDAYKECVYNTSSPRHVVGDTGNSEEKFHDLIENKSDNLQFPDKFADPKKEVHRLTPFDYMNPPFPDEDAILAAIDIDNERAIQAKIKQFPISKKEKKNDQAS